MIKKLTSVVLLVLMTIIISVIPVSAESSEDVITIRIANCEEYIDEGHWGEDEVIDLESGDIFGENPIIDDFKVWYEKTYGKKINIEYSTYGTNEDLYNQMTLGDTFDLACPSDYMCLKMMDEDMLQPLSDNFLDKNNKENYYINGVSPYIQKLMDDTTINNQKWSDYSAGYMWGNMGFVYNPEYVTNEEASTWKIFENPKFARQITVKDSVRDTYFGILGLLNSEKLTSPEVINSGDYNKKVTEIMNDTSKETIDRAEKKLQEIRDNVYSFETDSGKSDMVAGKVVASFQWSGDGVYTLDQAEEDDCYLEYAVPEESSNLWCDAWVMLKDGINGDREKQDACEAFINYISRPDNVIRNMYYVGYTSCISGGDDRRIFEYADWCYGAEDDEENTIEYPLGFFFVGDESDEDYIITALEDQSRRQLFSQYPTKDVLDRCAVMTFFNDEENARMNQMWINVRCFNLSTVPTTTWIIIIGVVLLVALIVIFIVFKNKIYHKKKLKHYTKIS